MRQVNPTSKSGDLPLQNANTSGSGAGVRRVVFTLSVFSIVASCFAVKLARAQTTLPELNVTAETDQEVFSQTSFSHSTQVVNEPAALATTTEVIARSPGTTVRRMGSIGQFSSVSIRGSSSEQVAVYLDGVRLNAGGFGTMDLSTVPLSNLESVEVVRGGSAAIGAGGPAIGGSINLISKRAELGKHVSIELAGGSFLTLQTRETFSNRTLEHSFLISHTHQSSKGNYSFQQASIALDGTSIGGGAKFVRENNRVLSEDLLIKFEHEDLGGVKLKLANDFFFGDRQLPGTEIETTQLAPANPLEAKQQMFRNTTSVIVSWKDLFTKRLDLELGLQNSFESSRFQDASPAFGSAIDRLSLNDTINPFMLWEYRTRALGKHKLTARYDYLREMFKDSARNSTTLGLGERARNTHSGFIQDEWELIKERLQVIPSVSLENVSKFGTLANYHLGIIGKPHKTFSIKGNIETADRVPTFSELYQPDIGFLRGNSALRAESAWQWDLGAALETKIIDAELVFFEQRIRNSILFVPISATTIAPLNTARATTRGIEASTTLRAGELARLRASYTWLRARFNGNGAQLPGRPVHNLHLRGELRAKLAARWSGMLFADFDYISALPLNVSNTVSTAARGSVDLGTRIKFLTSSKSSYFGNLEMQNIGNVQIYDTRGFPLPRRAMYLGIGGEWG